MRDAKLQPEKNPLCRISGRWRANSWRTHLSLSSVLMPCGCQVSRPSEVPTAAMSNYSPGEDCGTA